jgi:hypothetical protein
VEFVVKQALNYELKPHNLIKFYFDVMQIYIYIYYYFLIIIKSYFLKVVKLFWFLKRVCDRKLARIFRTYHKTDLKS